MFEFKSATGSVEFIITERHEYEYEEVVEEVEIGEEAVEEGGGGTVDVDEVASGLRRTTSSRLAAALELA